MIIVDGISFIGFPVNVTSESALSPALSQSGPVHWPSAEPD